MLNNISPELKYSTMQLNRSTTLTTFIWTCYRHVVTPKASPLPPLPSRIFAVYTLPASFSADRGRKFSPQPTMEKHPEANYDEAVKDEQTEGVCKGACEYKPTGRMSDRLLPRILNIYGCHATPSDFEIYAPDASFEDPLMCARGVKQIKSAFYSLSKIFSESEIVEYSVQENLVSPGKQEILIDNKQHYKFLGKDINMISLIKLHVEDGKVVRHEDWWDKKPLWNRETVKVPLVGRMIEVTRRGSMLATHAMMGFGKDPTV